MITIAKSPFESLTSLLGGNGTKLKPQEFWNFQDRGKAGSATFR